MYENAPSVSPGETFLASNGTHTEVIMVLERGPNSEPHDVLATEVVYFKTPEEAKLWLESHGIRFQRLGFIPNSIAMAWFGKLVEAKWPNA